MRNADVFDQKIAAWELFVASMQPLLEEMPYLQLFHDRIQGLIEEARELDQQQEKMREEARELVRRRQAVEKEGDNLRARASAHLNKSNGSFSAEIYKSNISPYYMVVIGENLTLRDAKALKEKARASGLPRDTYIIKPAPSPS